jgi:hypothetical protein
VEELIEGYHITFTETALSDLQILCYYAYSPLYFLDSAGQNAQLRSSLLGPDHCVGARMNVQLPAHITSSSATMTVTVQVPGASGQLVPASNMLVNLTPSCASVAPESGRTDGSGAISVTVTPTAGCSQVTITAVARADAGTAALAQQVATAAVSTGPIILSGSVNIHRNLDTSFDQTMSFTMTVTVGAIGTLNRDGLVVTQITGSFTQTGPGGDAECPGTFTLNAQIDSGEFSTVGSTTTFGVTGPGTSIETGCHGGSEARQFGFGDLPYTVIRAPDGHITALDFTAHTDILDFSPPDLFLHYNATGIISQQP